MDVTPAYQLNGTDKHLESSGNTSTLVVNFLDQGQLISDVAWTVAFSGSNDGDFSLEPTEKAIVTVWLVAIEFRHRVSDQRGITGLETAIILIAFVVVASVFAYTVLTAGIFSSQKSNEAINAALEEVRSSITPDGNLLAFDGAVDIDGDTATADTTDAVVRMAVSLGVALQGVPIDLTPPYQVNATDGSLEMSGLPGTLVVNYLDQRQLIQDTAWTVAFSGANDGDYALEATERAVLTVWLVEYNYDAAAGLYYTLGDDADDPFIDQEVDLLGNFEAFTLEISPIRGAPLTIERVIPQSLSDIMNLR